MNFVPAFDSIMLARLAKELAERVSRDVPNTGGWGE